MKKSKLIDFLIIILVYIGLSCFPFGLIIKDESLSWLILTLQIVVQAGLLTFIILFTIFKTELNYKFGKINIVNTLLLLPTLIVCFTNLINLRAADVSYGVVADVNLFLNILLTIFVVINEEIIFRLLFTNNLEIKNKVLVMRKLYASIVPDIGDEACYTIIPTAVLEDNNLQFALRIHHVECPIANGKRHLLVISIEIDIRIAAYLRPDVCHILVQTELNLQHWRILRHIVVLMKNLQAVVAAY